MEREERCEGCDTLATRMFVPRKLSLFGTKVTHAEYNPALGCVVKNKAHKEQILKEKNLIEVGNENPNRMIDRDDKARNEKLSKLYDED
jgi:hypothetical protein